MEETQPVELNRRWEHEALIRQRARDTQALMAWPQPHLVGAPSKRAFAMNRTVLEQVAKWWCPQVFDPQTVPIQRIRDEAG